jgi:hypothetical protein
MGSDDCHQSANLTLSPALLSRWTNGDHRFIPKQFFEFGMMIP